MVRLVYRSTATASFRLKLWGGAGAPPFLLQNKFFTPAICSRRSGVIKNPFVVRPTMTNPGTAWKQRRNVCGER
jgi:hypothetical protein